MSNSNEEARVKVFNDIMSWTKSIRIKDKKLREAHFNTDQLTLPLVRGQTNEKNQLDQNQLNRILRFPTPGLRNKAAQREKEKGNECYKVGNFNEAIEFYNASLSINPDEISVYTNRAMAWIKLHKYQEAEIDCTKALSIDCNSFKALWRRGLARKDNANYKDAIIDFEASRKVRPAKTNCISIDTAIQQCKQKLAALSQTQEICKSSRLHPETENAFRRMEIEEVEGSVSNGSDNSSVFAVANDHDNFHHNNNDKTVNNNKQYKKNRKTSKVKVSKKEKKSKSIIVQEAEEYKHQGNKKFKEGQYMKAMEYYTSAINCIIKNSIEGIDIYFWQFVFIYYSNRAACNFQLGQYNKAVDDCCSALNYYEEKNTQNKKKAKTLLRRALAFEAIGKEHQALADIKEVFMLDPTTQSAIEETRKRLQNTIKHKNLVDGTSVILFGLNSDMFNNQKGTISGSYVADTGRYPVKLCQSKFKQKIIGVRLANIQILKIEDMEIEKKAERNRTKNAKTKKTKTVNKQSVNRNTENRNTENRKTEKKAEKRAKKEMMNKSCQKKSRDINQRRQTISGIHEKSTHNITHSKKNNITPVITELNSKKLDNTTHLIKEHPRKDEKKMRETNTAAEKATEKATSKKAIVETKTITMTETKATTTTKTTATSLPSSSTITKTILSPSVLPPKASSLSKKTVTKTIKNKRKSAMFPIPRTHIHFERVWNKIKDDLPKFYQYFKRIEPKRYQKLFGTAGSLSHAQLSTILTLLKKIYIQEDLNQTLSVLENLAKTNRFDLNILMLPSQGKKNLEDIFSDLKKKKWICKRQNPKVSSIIWAIIW